MRARLAVTALFLCVAALIASAQSGSSTAAGALTGTVRNAAGTALRDVSVYVSGTALGSDIRSATTDARGSFTIPNLPAGTYRVEFVRNGFKTHVRAAITIGSGTVPALTIQMVPGEMADVVFGDPAPKPPAPPAATAKTGGGQKSERATTASAAPAPVVPPPPVQVGSGFGWGSGSGAGVGAPGRVPGGVPGGVVGGQIGAVPYTTSDAPTFRSGVSSQDSYTPVQDNPFQRVSDDPLSTFSVDTDSASYANVRRFLNAGTLPPRDAVRIEELINYFHFDYPQPTGDAPFSITTELAVAPWDANHRLALIGLQGKELLQKDVPPRNLVFLLDVSGSMQPSDRLPLVQRAMQMLVDTLRPSDRVAIVTYAGNSGLALPSTTADQKVVIQTAIERLAAGGSTNGGEGLRLAYDIARKSFVDGGVNRVILATDGDFNVGVTSQGDLLTLIESERKSGVFLSVLGVGTGNLKDSTMELLADKGNGNYAYLDSLQEARRVLIREAGATLVTIAKDVKLQVEFNPATVAAYRLIGYENRVLRKEDFNDDRKDAGEIGAGHTVTALYEIVPVGAPIGASVDELKYQRPAQPAAPPAPSAFANELLTVKLRYKAPSSDTSRLLTRAIENKPQALAGNIAFASSIAEFGMLLRDSPHKANASYEGLLTRARQFRGSDADGYRAEFIRLADVAAGLPRSSGTR